MTREESDKATPTATPVPAVARPAGLYSFGLAPVLLWMVSAACLLCFTRTSPEQFPVETAANLTFIVLWAAIGGALLASLVWYTPAAIRGESARWEPGEVLLFGLGWMVAGDCVAMTVAEAWYPEPFQVFGKSFVRFERASLHTLLTGTWGCVVWSALTPCHSRALWKVVSAVLAVVYLPFVALSAEELSTMTTLEASGRSGLIICPGPSAWMVARWIMPWLLAPTLLWAVAVDMSRKYGVAHWLGVTLLVVAVLKQLHYAGWLQQTVGISF